MLCLRTFGGLALERDDGPLTAPGPRRRLLALLALLAGHDPPGIGRDKLQAYLWPESDADRARNSLKQALHSIRQALGIPLVSSGGVLRLDSRFIQTDLWQFEAALDRGDETRAVQLYRGPFLEGFSVPSLEELQGWIEDERERLARRHALALRTLAELADAHQERSTAVTWWQRLAEVEPLSSSAALGLMRALVAAGDTTAAREHARAHAAYLREELGGPIAEAVSAYERQLSERPAPRHSIEPASWTPPRVAVPINRRPTRAAVAAGAMWAPRAWSIPAVPRAVWRAVIAIWALAFLLNLVRPPVNHGIGSPGLDVEPLTLAVAPFSTIGAESGELGRALVALLEARLDGSDGVRILYTRSAAAEKTGARLYLQGQLVVAGGRLRAVTTLFDRGNANLVVGRAEAEAETGDVFELADALAGQLIAGQYRGAHERLTKVAVMSTRSLPALKAYLLGERRFQADSYPAAIDAFRQAVRADPAFALAYYRLSGAADWEGRRATALWAAELAARFSDRLSEHDRRLVRAYLVQRRGRIDEAERLYRGIVVDFPDDAEAWFQLGDVLFRLNPLRGRSAEEATPALQRVVALEPDNKEALVYLARLAWLRGDRRAVDSLIQRTARTSRDSTVLGLRAFRTFALGDRPGRNQTTRELIAQPGLVPATVALQAAVFVDDLTGSERFAELLAAGPRSCELRGLGQRMLAQAQLARGRPASARVRLAAPMPCDAAASLELRALYDALPFIPVPQKELKAVLRALQQWKAPATRDQWEEESDWPAGETVRLYGLGLISVRLGDSLLAHNAAIALARRSNRTPGGEVAWSFSRSIRARLALLRDRPADALAYLESARWERTAGRSLAEASDRFLRAELLLQLGRVDEAVGWYRSIAERSSYELVYLAPSQFRLGQIYDGRRNTRQAVGYYRRFRELWQSPDRQLQPMIAQADRRLRALAATPLY
jgi:DNA-binding SARP family transcriptional activator/tetratricopeptide (TPR) repeat protein